MTSFEYTLQTAGEVLASQGRSAAKAAMADNREAFIMEMLRALRTIQTALESAQNPEIANHE